MEASPVDYETFRGSLFDDNCTSDGISCVFTNFHLDHKEPLDALRAYKARGPWLLGELLDGHESPIILPISGTVIPPMFLSSCNPVGVYSLFFLFERIVLTSPCVISS